MPSKKSISVRGVQIGGGAPVRIQSMTNTDTRDVAATVDQIRSLVSVGCEIVRVTIPDQAAADAFARIRREVPNVPLVADIHFDWRMALAAVAAGADKIRINPGNLGGPEKLREVAEACKKAGIPIRVGVNAGSLEADLKSNVDIATALAESALRNVKLLEEVDFTDIIISAKASSVPVTVAAYRELAKRTEYPLHLGITEAGGREKGTIKSAAGLGALLIDGIGDTIRISLTAPPEEEIPACLNLLRALELRNDAVNVVSCPTCGRTEVDLVPLVERVEKALENVKKPLTVAVMGCVVNGPGEASHADFALIGGKNMFALMKAGKLVRTLREEEALPALLQLVDEA